MTTEGRRGVGAVLTALCLVLAAVGLVPVVTRDLQPQPPQAVAPIDLQGPVGPEAPPSPPVGPAAESSPDTPADAPTVVAGPEITPPTSDAPTSDAPAADVPAADAPTIDVPDDPSTARTRRTSRSMASQDARPSRDAPEPARVTAVAIEDPEPRPAGSTRTMTAASTGDPATPTQQTPPPDAETDDRDADTPGAARLTAHGPVVDRDLPAAAAKALERVGKRAVKHRGQRPDDVPGLAKGRPDRPGHPGRGHGPPHGAARGH